MKLTDTLDSFQNLVYYGMLANLGKYWTNSQKGWFYVRGKHVTSKHKARLISTRYLLTYSGRGLYV